MFRILADPDPQHWVTVYRYGTSEYPKQRKERRAFYKHKRELPVDVPLLIILTLFQTFMMVLTSETPLIGKCSSLLGEMLETLFSS
jgi:hypothetical protein